MGRAVISRAVEITALGILMATLPFGAGLAAKKKTLTVWAPGETQFKTLCKNFEKENPNVEVKLISGAIDKFYTMVVAGQMPDLWGPWDTPGIKADVNRNWAVDMTPYIQRDSKEIDVDDFFPGVMRQFRINGKQYSLPMFDYVDYFFYNTKLYADAGIPAPPINEKDKSWNWDRMITEAKKMTKYDSRGRITVAGTEISTDPYTNPNYFYIWKTDLFSSEALRSAVPQEIHWTDPTVMRALTKAWELMHKYQVSFTTTGGFANGKIGSSMYSGPMVNTYMRTKNLKWAIAPLPWGDTNEGTLWPDGWRIGKMSKDKELAWKFVKFTCRPDNMTYMVSDPKSQRLGTPATRKSVFRKTLGKDIGKQTGMDPEDVFTVHSGMDLGGHVKLQDMICIYTDFCPFWNPVLRDLWDNKTSPAQAAQKLQDVTNRQLPVMFQRWIRNIKFTGSEKKR